MREGFLLILMFSYLILINRDVTFSKDLKNSNLKKIFVVSNGWHTGFIIPSEHIMKKIPDLAERFKNKTYIEFGWGDEGFYQSEEFSLGIAISALFWPTDSVIHAVGIPRKVEGYFSNSEVEKICLNRERFSSLINYISNSFFKDKNGNLLKLKKGLYGDSQFYRGVDDFHLMNTCNRWTANGLRSIGLEISTKNKLTAGSVMNYIEESKKELNMNSQISCKNELNN
tara:strand:- start:172 stop:852 length:681 start_codon:yes stop_codon:yes gene_type:complete